MGTNEKGASQEKKIVCDICQDTGEVMIVPDLVVGGEPVDAIYGVCHECYPPKEQDYDEWRDSQE